MLLPTPLSRHKKDVFKNQFGHVLVLAGSGRMLGAAALTALAAMRTGAGLVTLGIPQSLQQAAQKKISNVIMTLPLRETQEQTIAYPALVQIRSIYHNYQSLALGPGLSRHPSTQKFVMKLIAEAPLPMVVDADALNILSVEPDVLKLTQGSKVLTPHPGEMARLSGVKKDTILKDRAKIACQFACRYHCVVLLKGHRTIVAAPQGNIYTNKTGNPGMATAGSGDVLTGMIASLLGQGLPGYEAACWGAYLHGLAGDIALKTQTCASLIASDMIDHIGQAQKKAQKDQRKVV